MWEGGKRALDQLSTRGYNRCFGLVVAEFKPFVRTPRFDVSHGNTVTSERRNFEFNAMGLQISGAEHSCICRSAAELPGRSVKAKTV